jgi:high-affinity Fe2+/Pb2+ permease
MMVRTVSGLAIATACGLAYFLSGVNQLEAVLIPGIILGLVAFGVAVYGRVRNRRQWSAAWEAYAKREVAQDSFGSTEEDGALSIVGTN